MRFCRLLIAILMSCQLLNAQNQTFSLSGKVVDTIDKAPISGARISVLTKSVVTDTNGEYFIENLPQGKYEISISFIGYEVLQALIMLDENRTNLNFSLKPKETMLSEIVVTGTGTQHYQKDAPVQTEVIRGKALQEYSGRSIEDVLGGLSSSLTFSANDMGSNLQLNGLSNDYVLILLDGRRINGDVGGQNDLNRINLNNIDRIEIVKGAVSSLYGSDAIGGVINFISKKKR